MKHLEYNKLRNTIIENSKVIKEEVMSLEFWCEIQTPNGRGTFIEDVQDVYSLWIGCGDAAEWFKAAKHGSDAPVQEGEGHCEDDICIAVNLGQCWGWRWRWHWW